MAAPQQIEQVRLPSVCTCFPARRAVNITNGPTAISLPKDFLISRAQHDHDAAGYMLIGCGCQISLIRAIRSF